MKKGQFFRKIGLTLVFLLFLAAVLTVSTYAWFTANPTVSRYRASVTSGSKDLELQISSSGEERFESEETADIVQVNASDRLRLMPVSTADLTRFVYNPATEDDLAETFLPVENEEGYYHGRVYLQALGTGFEDNARVALYLDENEETGGALGNAAEGSLLNAVRLGLVFGDDEGSRVILRFPENRGSGGERIFNTVINGAVLGENEVLGYENGELCAVEDPSVDISEYVIQLDDTSVRLPARPLMEMELNQIYVVDVYFYIEGCDPDCSGNIHFDTSDLHLAFYGILTE